MTTSEQVVLLDETGAAIGTAAKAEVHHADTPLHLAFSCYVFDEAGPAAADPARARHKPTFGGVWTNSCCGHPAPGEAIDDAVRRRVEQEVGLDPRRPALVLPAFRYRAVMANGVVENEMCPVFVATTTATPPARPGGGRRTTSGSTGDASGRASSTAAATSARGASSRWPRCPPDPRRRAGGGPGRPPGRGALT